ncbi:polysaccharide biosynthesis protein [Paenibacillus sp. UMB4589-SE434]|uniref:putative polysaccharide biosynthesis protein n=1 Tax=Paenibacillus sp. UMB4589-SE434 TaxID=3046314 RepID=UPI0025501F30|nr:polysaccharide biosynthesis protein [Paenibacillus sp. UMB4589-SE434]MDK8183870.1 polysaccharide biosynthesis protein [Paenibacillus sp. UMB4589-SE434]
MAKESFIKGTLIIAAATLVARVLGVFQRVPLEHMLGSVGNAAFATSQNVYLMILAIATAGIPSTLSKMVSERYALNQVREAERVYAAALLFGLISGVVVTLLLFFLAPVYATAIKQPEAALAIRALAPALLLFPMLAMMRGYTQGRNMMQASGVSQIIEQILRVATAIALALILVNNGASQAWAAAGASFGGVLGSIGAFAVMIYYLRKLRRLDREAGVRARRSNTPPVSLKAIFASIFALSIPIVLASLAVPLVNFIDSSITVPLLSSDVGEATATHIYGILGQRAQSIAGIPPILAIALSTSIIPVISAAYAKRDMQHLQRQISLAMRISVLSGMPIVLALGVGAFSINGLLFSSLDGAGIIAMLTLGTILQITMMTSSSILIGLGKPYIAMISVTLGIILKLIFSFVLAQFIGVYGIITATMITFLIITYLNLRVMKKVVKFDVMGKRWPGFMLATLLAGGLGYLTERLGEQLVGITAQSVKYGEPLAVVPHAGHKIGFMFTAGFVGIVVLVVFIVGLVVFRVVRRDELGSYPRIVQKVLRPIMQIQKVGSRG